MAVRLTGLLRRDDTAARLGGDEFVIVISGFGRAEAIGIIANRVLQAMAEPFHIEGHDLRVGTSIGIAIAPRDGLEGSLLLKSADAAMYQAKRQGRSTFRLFSADPGVEA